MKTRFFIVSCLAMLVMACGAADTDVPVTVKFPLSKSVLSSLSKVTLSVSASDMTTVSSSQTGPFSSSVSFSVDVPTGNSRTFSSTASVSGSTSTGYQGSTTGNVTTSTTSVPITMLFMNSSTNSTAAVGSGPQITSVTIAYTSTQITFTVGFGSTVSAETLAFIMEFIPSSGGTARSQSMINQAKGSVTVSMPSAGTHNIIVNGQSSGGFSTTLYNSSDSSVSLTSSELSASLSGSTNVVVTMSRTAFTTNIDSSIIGTMNILAGSKSSGTVEITPSNLSALTASSAAVNTSNGDVMKYNASFDTTNL